VFCSQVMNITQISDNRMNDSSLLKHDLIMDVGMHRGEDTRSICRRDSGLLRMRPMETFALR